MGFTMVEYYKHEEYLLAKEQRDRVLIVYVIAMLVYLAFSVGMLIWYLTLPYESPTISTVKLIQYSVSAVAVIFSFIYLGIPFKRVNRYYKLCYQLENGIKETSTGSFFEYNESLQDKDGVDCKAIVFLEWNKFKNDFFERKVLVFEEKEFPKFEENMNVRYVTQSNILMGYEILDTQKEGE